MANTEVFIRHSDSIITRCKRQRQRRPQQRRHLFIPKEVRVVCFFRLSQRQESRERSRSIRRGIQNAPTIILEAVSIKANRVSQSKDCHFSILSLPSEFC